MSDRTIPVAYVTRWATTAGIRIIRNGVVTESGAIMTDGCYAPKRHWTEDRAVAEARYCAAIDAARQSAERKAKKLAATYNAPPKYTEG